MDHTQIALVQESFEKIVPNGATTADLFYADLFATAPEVRPLFKGPMDEQGMKLFSILGVAVKGLRDLEKIVPVITRLAVQHVEYGVKAEHYSAVGASLLRALEQGLGPDFTEDTRDAWATAYGTLASLMIAAAYGPDTAEHAASA